MKIEIRHRLLDIEEEVYSFEINNTISYIGISFSNRNDINDVFGYDWKKEYPNKEQEEIKNVYKKHHIDEEEYDPIYGRNSSLDEDLDKIDKKYNPIMNKTIHGKSYLRGTYGYHVSKEHPLKISREQIIDAIIEKIKTLEIK